MKFKELYVIGGHRDRMTDIIVHSLATLHLKPTLFLFVPAAMFFFYIRDAGFMYFYL